MDHLYKRRVLFHPFFQELGVLGRVQAVIGVLHLQRQSQAPVALQLDK